MWKDIVDVHVKKGLDYVKKVTTSLSVHPSSAAPVQADNGTYVYYHYRDLREEAEPVIDPEESLFFVPSECSSSSGVTVGRVKEWFAEVFGPVPLWLRFKLEDEELGFVWIDGALSDTDFAPTFRGSVHAQISRFSTDGSFFSSLSPKLPDIRPDVAPPSREALVKERLDAKEKQVKAALEFVQSNAAEEANKRAGKISAQNLLGTEMDKWAFTEQGKFKDVRSLLSSMGSVLWPNSGWEEVPIGELMISGAAVKKCYRKAIILTHPDRHQRESAEQQYRADRVFNALNESFKSFST